MRKEEAKHGQTEAPIKKAVALSYDPNDQAPQVIASGKGELAERIIKRAEEHAVPTYVDEGLAETLMHLDIGDYIPPELYGVVAEILVYVDNMDRIKDKLNTSGKAGFGGRTKK